jgi:GDP-4-dehydro-6-deoxy-D-mannose reductase
VSDFLTGGGGFAGGHLLRLLGDTAVAPRRDELDLLDADAVRSALAAAPPERVFHLAALASVGHSWRAPGEVLFANIAMTLNLLEAVRQEAPEAACDLLGGQYTDAHDLRVARVRAFNHAGPGQSDDYVVGTLTRQVAEAEAAGAEEVTLRTGNPDPARDFTDVRDVARAYVAAATLEPGVYNVCSGQAASVHDLIAMVTEAARLPVRHDVDPERFRPHDVPEVRGSADLLTTASGWKPEIPLKQTVADALDAWRERLKGGRK